MNRAHLALMMTGALGSALVGCGDNSKLCGPNTTDVDGVCTADPSNPPVMCTDGTVKDPTTGNCVIDPNSCQDGTVLVGGACVDPGHTTPTITEAAEPNGLGLNFGEDSEDAAGLIVLKPVGEHFVIKGKIAPFQDTDGDGQMDPDIDTYVLAVTAPTMLNITADGLHGLAAGFVSIAGVASPTDPLANWVRFGLNLSGDTSKRQLFLPAAGTYAIGVADTRSLFLAGGAVGPAAGAPDFDYYITVDVENLAPTALTVDANGVAQSVGELAPGETKLFSVPMGLGINTALYDVVAEQAVGSMVINNTSGGVTTTRAVADVAAPDPATATLLGFRTGDMTLVAADSVFNYAIGNIDYALTIQAGGAGELSKVGGNVSQPANEIDFSVFFYDVATDGEVTGMDIAYDIPVVGVVVDETFTIFANFTFDPANGFNFLDTFTSYKGLLRHQTKGRYYFFVFDADALATTITATSTYAPLTVTAVTAGTPLTAQAINQVAGGNPYTYDAGASGWDAFTIGADGGTTTGNITAAYLPLDTSFGRIDPLASTCTVGATDFCADVFPLFTHSHVEAGSTVGRILLNDGNKKYFVSVRPTTAAGAQVRVDYRPRDHVDLGTLAAGTTTRDDEVLSDTVTVKRYLLRTDPGSSLSFTVTPIATLDTRFQQLNNTESNRGAAVNNGIIGLPDTVSFLQNGEGWTAFTVTSVVTLTGTATFDLSIVMVPPPYSRSAGATAFSDACVGGTAVTLQDVDEGFSTAAITTPAGFNFFGAAAGSILVNSNGFITPNTALTCPTVGSSCFFSNSATMPNTAAPQGGLIAPYWDDLVLTSMCQKTDGTKLILQWRGTPFLSASTVEFQAILDGATSTIEFVYGPGQSLTGQSASIGLENQAATLGVFVGANTAGLVSPAASILFTPN